MQIDRYNHLLFPRDATPGGNSPPGVGKDAASASGSAVPGVLVKPQTAMPAQAVARAVGRLDGVVLKIQWPDGTGAKPVDAPLYTPGRRMPAAATVDTGAMAREHQLAVDRQAGGSVTPIAVSKDGVLVASRPAQATEHQQDAQPDFVALAVSAMREYRDDPERQRASAPVQSPVPETHWGAFKGLQQIAAKLNVFA